MELKKVLAITVFLVLALLSSASIMSVQAQPISNSFDQLRYAGYACICWHGTNGNTQSGTYSGKANLQFFMPAPSLPADIIMDLSGYPYSVSWNYKGTPIVYGDYVLIYGEPVAPTAMAGPPWAITSPVTIIVHDKTPYYVIVVGCCVCFSGQGYIPPA